jgi:hypothetical protein
MGINWRTRHQALARRFAGGARTDRRAAGGQAARGPQMGEAQANPLTAPSQPRAEREAAGAQHRSANAAANKQGSFSRGGNADAPERQKP